jgi:hypothetical protein
VVSASLLCLGHHPHPVAVLYHLQLLPRLNFPTLHSSLSTVCAVTHQITYPIFFTLLIYNYDLGVDVLAYVGRANWCEITSKVFSFFQINQKTDKLINQHRCVFFVRGWGARSRRWSTSQLAGDSHCPARWPGVLEKSSRVRALSVKERKAFGLGAMDQRGCYPRPGGGFRISSVRQVVRPWLCSPCWLIGTSGNGSRMNGTRAAASWFLLRAMWSLSLVARSN